MSNRRQDQEAQAELKALIAEARKSVRGPSGALLQLVIEEGLTIPEAAKSLGAPLHIANNLMAQAMPTVRNAVERSSYRPRPLSFIGTLSELEGTLAPAFYNVTVFVANPFEILPHAGFYLNARDAVAATYAAHDYTPTRTNAKDKLHVGRE